MTRRKSEGRPTKKPSGAAFRKARAERERAEAREERERRALAAASDAGERAGFGLPPADAVGRATWAQQVAASIVHELVNDPVLGLRERAKLAFEGIRSIGMVSLKAHTAERLERLERKIYRSSDEQDATETDDGLEDLDEPVRGERVP